MTAKTNPLKKLVELGQSIWLDFINRNFRHRQIADEALDPLEAILVLLEGLRAELQLDPGVVEKPWRDFADARRRVWIYRHTKGLSKEQRMLPERPWCFHN